MHTRERVSGFLSRLNNHSPGRCLVQRDWVADLSADMSSMQDIFFSPAGRNTQVKPRQRIEGIRAKIPGINSVLDHDNL